MPKGSGWHLTDEQVALIRELNEKMANPEPTEEEMREAFEDVMGKGRRHNPQLGPDGRYEREHHNRDWAIWREAIRWYRKTQEGGGL